MTVSDQSIQRQKLWNHLQEQVRAFFKDRNVLEVQTPTLVPSPGIETYLEPFQTEFKFGSSKQNLFLPTSPEFHLKKLIFAGLENIFEIKTCFRNNEQSEKSLHHRSEFWMLEWYRSFSDLNQLIEEVSALVQMLQPGVLVQVTSFADLFRQEFDFSLTPKTTQQELAQLCDRLRIPRVGSEDWDELFHLLVIEKIEPHMNPKVVTVIRDFPPSQAALAKINARGWADRFEVYWQGLELANAYNELLDADEQLKRWEQINTKRTDLNRPAMPYDHELIAVMRDSKIASSCGIALGMDRLFMALNGIANIRDTRWF